MHILLFVVPTNLIHIRPVERNMMKILELPQYPRNIDSYMQPICILICMYSYLDHLIVPPTDLVFQLLSREYETSNSEIIAVSLLPKI